jgi:hypothetical protein
MLQGDGIGGVRAKIPARPPGQAVDGVAAGRLAQIELVGVPAEGVPAPVDAIRPGCQQLARRGCRQLVGLVTGDNRRAAVTQPPQPRGSRTARQ